jgi:hypothetical protein
VAELPRTEVDAGDLSHVGVVAEGTTEARVGVEKRRFEVPEIRQVRVQPDGRVSFAQDEAIPVFPTQARRVEAKLVVVEDDEQLRRGKRAAVVTGAGDSREPQRL